MALLNKMNLEGFILDSAYWRIGALEWNTNEKTFVKVRIDGYASLEAYRDGNTAIRSFYREISLNDEALLDIFNEVRTYCYDIVKQQEEFLEAIDA